MTKDRSHTDFYHNYLSISFDHKDRVAPHDVTLVILHLTKHGSAVAKLIV